MATSRMPLKQRNDFFLGITSPLTTQGEVTVNVQVDAREVVQRRNNMSHDISRVRSYPGGDKEENLYILPGEAVFGWVDCQGRNRVPGNPSQIGFTTMNGIKYGRFTTDEELAGRIRFIGIAKAAYKFDDPQQLKHGFACLAVGSTTTFNTGITDIQAGDIIEWNVVPRPVAQMGTGRAVMPDGQYGDDGPGSRQGHPSYGTPHGKLRFRLNASRFNDLTPSLNHAVSCMLRTSAQGGISDRPLEHLFVEGSLGPEIKKMTPSQEYAMSLLMSDVVTAMRVVELLQTPGGAPVANYREIAGRIGLFSKDPNDAQKQARENLICGLYMVPAAGVKGRQAFTAFKDAHPSAFKGQSSVLKRQHGDFDNDYACVATQLGRYKEVGFARAVHAVARRRLGMALSPSGKGCFVDLLVGHKQESY